MTTIVCACAVRFSDFRKRAYDSFFFRVCGLPVNIISGVVGGKINFVLQKIIKSFRFQVCAYTLGRVRLILNGLFKIYISI